jgi:Arc/MetJ-type ribon-helix-helix transcriptional regulator
MLFYAVVGMPKKKTFETTIHIWLPKDLRDFLEGMVREGAADSISQAARKAIAFAKDHMHKEAKP